MPTLRSTLVDAHAALANFKRGDRSHTLGAELARLTDLHEAGPVKFSKDTADALYHALSTVYADVAADVEVLLNVLLDDAALDEAFIWPAGSPEEFDGWLCPVYAELGDDEDAPQVYCDLFAATPAAQADFLFSELAAERG